VAGGGGCGVPDIIEQFGEQFKRIIYQRYGHGNYYRCNGYAFFWSGSAGDKVDP
jgi:hypothetical protein